MKKIKFLSYAVMAAFMAFGLASCEKENFNTQTDVDIDVPEINIPGIEKPEGYKPGDALVSIQPTVIAVINGDIKTVTSECTFTFNGKDNLEYTPAEDGSIAAMEVTVKATYVVNVDGFSKTLEAETVVKVPALSPGQVAILTPTLIVNINGEANINSEETSSVKDEIISTYEVKNTADYYYTDVQGEIKVQIGYDLKESNIEDAYKDNQEVLNYLEQFNHKWDEIIPVTLDKIYAQSMTCIPYTVTVETIKSKLWDTITWSRSETTEKVLIGEITYTHTYNVVLDLPNAESNINLNGHAHGHGHGHGSGHGGSNAGGGIIWGI